jgi:uncharacterized protein involved in exopolysaccharide biosynthesis
MDALNQSGGGAAGLSEESPWNRDLWQILLEKAWLIICIVVAAGAIGYYRAEKTPRVYQSRAVIFLDFGEQVVVKMDEVDKREKAGVDLLNTIANNIRSSSVLKRVVTAKNLTQHPYFKQWSSAPTDEMVVGMLSGSIDARLRRFTRLIDVTAEFGDPALAQLVAQSVVEEYISLNNDERSGVGTNAARGEAH